jgi:hypothetical protein
VTNAGPVAAGALTSTLTFTRPTYIGIPWSGRAWPYPSALSFSSVPGLVRNMTVTLNSFSHTYPGDVSALLVGPGGQSVVLMSNVGGGADASWITLKFNDWANPLASGTLHLLSFTGLVMHRHFPTPPWPGGSYRLLRRGTGLAVRVRQRGLGRWEHRRRNGNHDGDKDTVTLWIYAARRYWFSHRPVGAATRAARRRGELLPVNALLSYYRCHRAHHGGVIITQPPSHPPQ